MFFLDSAFKQQRLPAWQPILTAGTVLPTFFVIGIAFIPVGIGLLYFSDEVKEKVIDYTHCTKVNYSSDDMHPRSYADTGIECAKIIASGDRNTTCKCRISFTLDTDFAVSSHIFILNCSIALWVWVFRVKYICTTV